MAFTQLPTGGGVPNVDFITQTLAKLQPDSALQNYARMHKNDPYILSLATAESNRRKALRTAAQGQVGQQPTVVDQNIAGMATPVMTGSGGTLQTGYGGPVMTGMASGGLPEDQGIAQLPTPNMQRMADGGIAGYEDDEEGMATGGMGGMFNFAQQSEPVLRMAGGGGGLTEMRKLVLKELQYTTTDYLQDDKVKRSVDKIVQERLGTTAAAAKPTAATPTAAAPAAPTKEGALYKPAKLAGQAAKATSSALKGIPYISGGIGAYQGLSDLKNADGFYNDPNVPTLEKAKQAGLTTLKAGLPIAGTAVGSLFTPAGAFVGGAAGTAASEYLDLETDALKAWKKANPQATPEQAQKAAVALAPAYDGPKLNAAQAERAVTGQPTITPIPEAKPDPNAGGVRDLLPAVNATPSKALSIDDSTALGDKFLNSKSRIADINRQVLQEQVDANRAKENSIEALAAFNKKQGLAYEGYEQTLKKEELQDATDKEKAGLMALFKGFLGVAAGESPNAAVNIAKGALLGVDDYNVAMKDLKKSAKERNKEFQFIQQARRAEERGDFDKVQMYEDKANTANQASARFGIAAINDITNAGGKISSDIYNTTLSNISRENIAAAGERGATARANAQLNSKGQTERLVDRMSTDPKFAATYRDFASIGPDARGDQAIIAKYTGPQGQIALQMLETQGPEGKAQAELIKQIIKQNTGSMLRSTSSPTGQVLVGQ
jgi:hypothetical protein